MWILRFRVDPGDSRVRIICFIKIQAGLLDVILDRYTSQKLRLDHNKTKLTPAKICSIHMSLQLFKKIAFHIKVSIYCCLLRS